MTSKLTNGTNSNNLIPVIVQQPTLERAAAYGGTTSVTKTTKTNVNNIDGLLSGIKWLSNTVTFSFTNNFTNDYEDESDYPDKSVHSSSFQTLNPTQRAVARQWFDMYESVSRLNMVELTDASDRDATIRIAESNHPPQLMAIYLTTPSKQAMSGSISPSTTTRLSATMPITVLGMSLVTHWD